MAISKNDAASLAPVDGTSHVEAVYEKVPSRYALQVGKIDVLVISDGVLSLPGPMLGHNAEASERTHWFEDKFLPADFLDWALNVVLVRSGERTILVDAGMGEAFPDLPRAGRTVNRLASAGIDLASVTDVIITHLHMDHVGGLLIEGGKRACGQTFAFMSLLLRWNFGVTPIFHRFPCRLVSRKHCAKPLPNFCKRTRLNCTHSKRNTRLHPACVSFVQAGILPDTAW
ncbi:MBL fold metallo-hydrolase [Enterobacter ludwigii]|uniref:MBL fold metallo-hydrolase n=1 Tax=Enterobacter ludwigii TaxID=299767 RepID=UPI004067DE54